MPSGVYLQGGQGSQKPGNQINSDLLWGAIFAALKPYDYSGPQPTIQYGHYQLGIAFANTAAQAGPLFTYRWANTPQLMVPVRISMSVVLTTAFTTPQVIDVKATIARAYTVSATGGTAATPFSGNSAKMRTSMGTSLVTDMRWGNVTAGTRTLDAQPFAVSVLSSGNTALAGVLPQEDVYNIFNPGQHPIVHAVNEGIEISANTALGAAGVLTYYVTIAWAEVAVF